jgi:TRAP-type C4-dicarboxylate transport system substrate-binding protein
LTISEKTWQKLSPADREAVSKAAKEASDWSRKEVSSNDDRLLAEMTAKGAKIARPNIEPWRDAVKPVYVQAKEKYGAEVDAILADADAVRKALPAK